MIFNDENLIFFSKRSPIDIEYWWFVIVLKAISLQIKG